MRNAKATSLMTTPPRSARPLNVPVSHCRTSEALEAEFTVG
jgi:hypothetical protein